jgi:arginine N-succinyltransferase
VTVLRPVERTDIAALQAMVERSSELLTGMSSLVPDPEHVEARVEGSIAAFDAPIETPGEESYLFVLDDEGEVWGMSGIIAAVGLTEPFWSYRVGSLVNSSRELSIYKSHPILFLTNDYTGAAELCSLFLDPSRRGANAGRLLSLGRMLFLADHADRFAERIIAEMRGVIDENGRSPLWRGLGIHFFDLPFGEADDIFGRGNKQFIAELMPQHPVYIDLLPQKAQAVIGQVHERTRPALRMLESEGLRYEGYVDIFDGGPTVAAPIDALRTVAESVVSPVEPDDTPSVDGPDEDVVELLVSAGRLADYRCIAIEGPEPDPEAPRVQLSGAERERLRVEVGDAVRVATLRPGEGRARG